LDAQDSIIEEARTRLEHALKDNSVVSAPWTVDHVSAGSVEVFEEYSADKLEFADHEWFEEDWDHLKPVLMETQDKNQQRREQINRLQDRLSDALLEGDNGVGFS
jgi:arginine decarboxylase-like protein